MNMKILYTTDLHGIKWKFEKISSLIKDHDLLIIGADILPKNVHDVQKQQFGFLTKYLPRFFAEIDIPIIIDFGNDDHMTNYENFKNMIDHTENVYYSHMQSFTINGVVFAGMHFVPDYPFLCKDWCRRDGDRLADSFQMPGQPVISSKTYGYERISNLQSYFRNHISIDEALDTIDIPDVLLTHAPPRTINLDVCNDMREVGSIAVTNYIIKNAPKLTLHGHIHESYYMTGKCIGSLAENSISIQPGQNGISELVYCEFNLNNVKDTFKRIIKRKG